MNLDIEVDFSEGDVLIINDTEWRVEDIDEHTAEIKAVKPHLRESRIFTRAELEEMILYSGKFTRIREDYISVF